MSNLDKYKVLVRRFVQNYYEIHGNFDKIELSILGKQIRALADVNQQEIIQFCYKQLGYTSQITEEILEQFARYQLGDTDYFITNGYVSSVEELPKHLAKHGNIRKPIFRERKYPKKLQQAIQMLTTYYNDSTELHICTADSEITTKVYISMLKLQNRGKLSINTLLSELQSANLLVTFKKADVDSIQNGIFYYQDYTDAQLQRIQKEAVANIAFGMHLNSGTVKNVVDLPFLPLNDNDTYLSLLDMCRGLGITYAEYMLNFGYAIKDQTIAIRDNSMIVNKVGDSIYVTDLSATEDKPVQILSLDDFKFSLKRAPLCEFMRMEIF